MPVAVTFKQLEALFWIARLGTFERAAVKLNTTQSAISKRIQELETAARFTIFDRNMRGARLTERGEHLLALSNEMLQLADRISELKSEEQLPPRKITIGVTELTAMTWLPRFVVALREQFPSVNLEPDVDMARTLHTRLVEGAIDLVVIPEVFDSSEIVTIPLRNVRNAWMAKPGLMALDAPLHLSELGRVPILTQGGLSGSGAFYNKWLRANGVSLPLSVSSNSLTALVGLTVAGLGISYLPCDCFQDMIDEGKLALVPTVPELPPVPYVAAYRNDRSNQTAAAVARLAAEVCDFTRPFQSGPS